MFPVTDFIPAYRAFVITTPEMHSSMGFSEEECEKIGKLAKHQKFELGRVGSSVKGGESNVKIRDSKIQWFVPDQRTEFLFLKLDSVISRVNYDAFQLRLTNFDGLQYTTYTDKGHYDWHVDVINEPPHPERFRKLSIVVMLSDPDEYDGGELVLNVDGNPDNVVMLKPKRGEIVFFYSHIPHKVMPVTKGERKTLVTWMVGPKLC